MNNDIQVLNIWSHGLGSLAYSAFALHLLFHLHYHQTARERSKAALLLAVVFSALWALFGFFSLLLAQSTFAWLSNIFDVLRYGGWYAFLLSLLHPNRVQDQSNNARWLSVVALVLVAAGLLIIIATALPNWFAFDLTRLLLLAAMVLPIFAMVLLEQVFRNASNDSRWNIKPLCLGLAGAFLFDLYLFSEAVLFNRLDRDAHSVRAALHAFAVPLLLLSSLRRNDWLAKIQLSPKLVFHSASLMLAGVYLLLVSGAGYYVRYFGGGWGHALQVGLVFLALTVLAIMAVSGSLRARLRVFLGKHFFRYRYDYREEWLKFTRALSAKNSPQEMGQQVIRGLADMLESPAGGLWLKAMGESAYSQSARWNMAQTQEKQSADSSLCDFMTTQGWVINLEEYRAFGRRYGSLKLPTWLQLLPQAWLVVPLLVGADLIGFVVLARARTQIEINWEINDLLKTAGQQAASYLAQMQATEALLEARKFDAFNRMSAFVVHDLKNIITQLSLMLKNAKRLGHNPEFQQDMLLTVENALDRMRQLMLQLREGAKPAGSAVGVNLESIVRRIQGVASARGRRLEVELAPDPLLARGHEERLERIVGHVVQNAFDATNADGRVWLHLDRHRNQARIVVGDTGAGMSQEFIRERLFKPFQSTKQAGMGIGAYESFQYVQELGGNIEVQSQPNQGTAVTIHLPLFESQTGSDLHLPRETA